MARRDDPDVPSPLLTIEQVNDALIGTLGEIGAAGGAIGGSAGGGFAGYYGGRSGGRSGARFGAKLFTRLDGARRTFTVRRTEQRVRIVRESFFSASADERFGPPPGASSPAVMLVGVVGSGVAGMNPCVVQLVWFEDQLFATAHAREGLIKQRTCARALERLAASLAVT